jgi:hypothetical protein
MLLFKNSQRQGRFCAKVMKVRLSFGAMPKKLFARKLMTSTWPYWEAISKAVRPDLVVGRLALIPQRWSDLWHRLQLEGTPAAMVALLGLTEWCYTMARRMILIGTKLKQYTHHLQLVYNDCKMQWCLTSVSGWVILVSSSFKQEPDNFDVAMSCATPNGVTFPRSLKASFGAPASTKH